MSRENNSGSIGLSGLLGIVFITLKLCGVINWPWLWVLAPFWIPFAILIVIMILAGIGIGIFAITKDFQKSNRRR